MTRPLNPLYLLLTDRCWFTRLCVLLVLSTLSLGKLCADESAPSTQQVATGFFVSDAGYLVTAHHVIAGLTDIKVVMSPRQVLRARTVKIDEGSDLALLKVDAITPFVYLSHSNGVPAGMDVITMGYPRVSVLGITTRLPGHRQQRAGNAR